MIGWGPSFCEEVLLWDLMGFEPAVVFVPFSLALFLLGSADPWSLLGVALFVSVAVEPSELLTLAEPGPSEH